MATKRRGSGKADIKPAIKVKGKEPVKINRVLSIEIDQFDDESGNIKAIFSPGGKENGTLEHTYDELDASGKKIVDAFIELVSSL
jgi:hypothetical protein